MSNQYNIIQKINQKVAQEKENTIGISIAMVMFGTGIGSINAAMAVQGKISLFILMTAIVLAVGTAVLSISQQPLKTIAWAFIASIIINVAMLIYQISIALS
ncbi:hypothetical protein CW731_04015 [Polaribacter sp. ALD11]|uniref:hypothetical protein n=1 Tax=Polaribacter sp. ALD11 TaxID=2058137 RepID=UPI000C3150E6|nr:hypothetical protein [Polaribacter sp. ALD11]AUC84515.1 hypothetical protein CW731_04015 [Polaribacter sp. ALD11]